MQLLPCFHLVLAAVVFLSADRKRGQIEELIEDGWWREVGAVKRKQRSLVYYISETEEGIQARLKVDRLILV